MTEYQQKRLTEKQALIAELNSLNNGLQWTLETRDSDNDYNHIQLVNGQAPINANYHEYQKEWSFYINHKLKYIRFDGEKAIREKLNEEKGKLNKIHKLNSKRVLEMVNRLTEEHAALVERSNEIVAKVEAFKAEIVAIGGTIGKIDPSYNTFGGEVVKNGIEFKYQVHDEGYISKDISIYYNVQDNIETFLALSDNKYTPKV